MEDKKTQKKTPLRKVVAQRNHDSAKVPVELREFIDQPLYVIIALWCHRQSDWIDRQQISDVFAITPRRASFQLSYILRQEKIINASSRKVRASESGRFRQEVRIHQVNLEEAERQKTMSRTKSTRRGGQCGESQEHWRWVLTRPTSDLK